MPGVLARVRGLDRPIALLAFMAFITQVGVAIMLPLLPLFAIELGATPFVLSLLVGAFAVAIAAGQLAAGFLVARFEARRLVVGGMGAYAAANLAIATAASATTLIAFRAVAGLGAGVAQVAERLYLTRVADPARLAFANGILSAAGSAGTVAGPAFGGILVALTDLRVPFLVVALTSAVAAVAGLLLPRPAAIEPSSAGDASPVRIGRPLLVLFLAQLAFQASFGAFITTYAPFATSRLGWATLEVGIVFSLFGLCSVLLGPWLARQADRRGRRNVAMLGAALVLAFPLVYVSEAPRAMLYPVTVVAGGGLTALQAGWFAMLGVATDGGRRGRAFGSVVALSSLGIVGGSLAAGQLWERTGDVGLGMLVGAGAIAATIVALAAIPADRPAPEPVPVADDGDAHLPGGDTA